MGKHRHKKSFYDVDEDELRTSRHHHRRRCRQSTDKQDEMKPRVPSIGSLTNSKIDDDQAALHSPPIKRQRSSSSSSQSPSKILSQLIENPEFLTNAGPKAKEFAETARQLLAQPDLDPTTQQIICAMAQAAVNVGKRLNSSSSLTPADQCVDEISVTNNTTYSSSTLLSPALSNTSSSSTSTTPQLSHPVLSREEHKASAQPESDEDILIKQMIERAMKLTQQGDTRHAQHLLGIIHEKLSNKRKRAAAAAAVNNDDDDDDDNKPKSSSSNDFYSLSTITHDESTNHNKISPSESEQSSDYQSTPSFSHPPPPPLPPPPPPPPMSDANSISSSVPRIEQVQELLSNPSEVQDILKKLFGANDSPKVSPPEEYQMQSHFASSFYHQPPLSFDNTVIYSPPSRVNNTNQPFRAPSMTTPQTNTGSQPYNSSLAFMQGNRRHLPPLQTPDRCFSSSSHTKNVKQQPTRSFSFSSNLSNNTGTASLLANSLPSPSISAPPLMKMNPTFSFPSSTPVPLESIASRWPSNSEHPRAFHPFWCATCALGFPHQVAYQEHLRSHVPCNVPGCSYTASDQLVRIHHQNIHDNNARNRMMNHLSYQTRPILHQQQSLEPPWPLMRM